MGLDQIGSIAEISAAVLVVASLIYVGRQLRQDTQSMRLDTVQAIIDEWNNWYDTETNNVKPVYDSPDRTNPVRQAPSARSD